MEIEVLKDQLSQRELEAEQARAYVYRCDGAIQVLKYLISLEEAPAEATPTPKRTRKPRVKVEDASS